MTNTPTNQIENFVAAAIIQTLKADYPEMDNLIYNISLLLQTMMKNNAKITVITLSNILNSIRIVY
jgi:hypothetical protein